MSQALLDSIDKWMGDHLEKKNPVLYSMGSQAGLEVIDHTPHLYNQCMWAELQEIST